MTLEDAILAKAEQGAASPATIKARSVIRRLSADMSNGQASPCDHGPDIVA